MSVVKLIEGLNSWLMKAGRFLDRLDWRCFIFFIKYVCPVLLAVGSILLVVASFRSEWVRDMQFFRIFYAPGFRHMKISAVCLSLPSVLYIVAEVLVIRRNES